eukprot:CAMPEP_0116022292 /NCGR_PEP_ID=MMETSP0321-20121206/10901_1 /TAXON_ID=163516 /ORGANISM="Leptocylindrus danicus var. danicus, Strain B650" /LENGTH=307 /DNA_ID=CAMNT_0003493337 /DNA_START=91 /DNA_END=1015 /DNA_ORIENTATION=-
MNSLLLKPLKSSVSVLTYDTVVEDADLFDSSSEEEEEVDYIDPELTEFSLSRSNNIPQSEEAKPKMKMTDVFIIIWQTEGLAGFYKGVRVMAIGKALITAVAFTADHVALFDISVLFPGLKDTLLLVVLASMFSGFVTSFITTPVERIKVILQAKEGKDSTLSDIDCINSIVNQDCGLQSLLLTGLFPTLCREVPSWAFYFIIYQVLMQTSIFQRMGALGPLIAGAAAGCGAGFQSVVKTIVQSDRTGSKNTFQVACQLLKEGGVSAFFHGMRPKLIRASISHGVTFFVYDVMMRFLTGGAFAGDIA